MGKSTLQNNDYAAADKLPIIIFQIVSGLIQLFIKNLIPIHYHQIKQFFPGLSSVESGWYSPPEKKILKREKKDLTKPHFCGISEKLLSLS